MDIVISLNKPQDITSQTAVTKIKRMLKARKAGHTGTLDPMATGLLLVCLNRATRLANFFSDLDKEYRAVMKLGETTDTQDACGKVVDRVRALDVSEGDITMAVDMFRGKILQKPPMFSALKHKGKSLHKYAREGVEIKREAREVTIHRIEILSIDIPYISLNVACSKGTYIRTLCHDIGQKLSTGAHLTELERTAIGEYSISDSLTFKELESISRGDNIKKGIYTIDEALFWLPEFKIDATQLKQVVHGNPIRINNGTVLPEGLKRASGIRIKSPGGALLAVGSYVPLKNMIKMNLVFS